MAPITITLTFETYAEAVVALERMHLKALPPVVVVVEDRSGVGVDSQASVAPDGAAPPQGQGGNPFAPQAEAASAVPPEAPGVPADPTTSVLASAPTPPVAPVPPTAATAPTFAPAVAPSPPLPPVELDADGLPWDGRIHSDPGKGKPKPKIADGTWRQRRSCDPQVKAAVEAELRQAMAARAPGSVAVAAAAPIAPTLPPAPPAVAPAPPAVAPVPLPAIAPPPAAPAAPAAETFGTLMARLAPRMGDAVVLGKIEATLQQYTLTSLAQLAARPDLVADFSQRVDAALAVA